MKESPLRAAWLQTIAQVFQNTCVYAVGGAVRNTLMGLPVSDVDLCGAARPEAVVELCEGTAVFPKLRAAHFGTVELHVNGHMAEYTTFRQDSYRTGHQPFEVRFADTIEIDAMRRDFSVNALYTPLTEPCKVIDPAGGLRHLREHILHTVTDNPDQVLKDDGLRILRAVRFQAELGFTLTEAVLLSAKKHVKLLYEIAAERKRDELTRLLISDIKYPMLSRAVPPVSSGLSTLVRIGAWPFLFGNLEPIDLSAFDKAADLDISSKFVLLYHRETPDAMAECMAALRYTNREVKEASSTLAALQAIQYTQSKLADILRFGLTAMHKATSILAVLNAVDSDYMESYARSKKMISLVCEKRLPSSLKELAIDGDDLIVFCRKNGMPKERIGNVLTALWQDAVNQRILNTRDALLKQANKHWIDSDKRE